MSQASRPSIPKALAALSLTQMIGWGTTFYLPAVTGPAMAADLGLSLPAIMAGPTVMLVLMALISWPLATRFERHGARPIMVLGSILGALGLLLVSIATQPALYFLAWAVLGLAGAGMLSTAAQIGINELAGDNSRRALGILMLASSLTASVFWPLTGLLQAIWGWRETTLLFAVAMLLVCPILHWACLARRPREAAAKPVDTPAPHIDLPRFILLAFSFAGNGFVTWGFSLTIIVLFEARGLGHEEALLAAALIGPAQWAARLFDFAVGGRWPILWTTIGAACLFPLSFGLLLFTSGFANALIFALVYGMAGGATAVARATLPLQIFPAGAYARAAARLALPLNLSFAAAPPAFAAILTQAGSEAALWLATATSILALLALLALAAVHNRLSVAQAA